MVSMTLEEVFDLTDDDRAPEKGSPYYRTFEESGRTYLGQFQKVDGQEVRLGYTADTPPPAWIAVKGLQDLIAYNGNLYDLTHKMTKWDPEIAGALNTYAMQCRKAYRGTKIRKLGKMDGKKRNIKKIKELLKIIDRKMDIPGKFYSWGYSAMRDGDVVIDRRDITHLEVWPMRYVTAVEKRSQVGNVIAPIFRPNFYILNELGGMQAIEGRISIDQVNDPIILEKSNAFHISVNPDGTITQDNVGRYCYNTWSDPPVLPLKITFLWKINSIVNDILIRHKHVPRLWIQANMENIFPSQMDGSGVEARVGQSESTANAKLVQMAENSRFHKADEDLISNQEVKFSYVEPSNTNYLQPNEMLDQLTTSITSALGVTKASLTGDTTGNYASELVLSSYATMRAEQVARKISNYLLDWEKELVAIVLDIDYEIEKIEKKNGGGVRIIDEDNILDNIYMDIRLMMKQDEDRAISNATQMYAMDGMYSEQQIRSASGYDEELPDDQKAFLKPAPPMIGGGKMPAPGDGKPAGKKSPQDRAGDASRRSKPIPQSQTPQSKAGKQKTNLTFEEAFYFEDD